MSRIERFQRGHHPRVVAGLGTSAFLQAKGIDTTTDLDWWQSTNLDSRGKLKLTAVPAQHFSGRAMGDRDRALWVGFIIESSGEPVYFAGDTAAGDHFVEISRRFGALRLAVLPIALAPSPRSSAMTPTPNHWVRLAVTGDLELRCAHRHFQMRCSTAARRQAM